MQSAANGGLSIIIIIIIIITIIPPFAARGKIAELLARLIAAKACKVQH